MLEIMRKHIKFFSIILWLVIISFVFWGFEAIDDSPKRVVAVVGKEKITIEEYWRTYDSFEAYYRQIKNEEEIKKLNLKDKVLDGMIDERVLMIVADKAGIKVTEDELIEAIMADPAFQKNGVFDGNIYRNILRLNRLTPEMYERDKRKRMLLLKMHRLIGEVVELSPDEVKILDALETDKGPLAEVLLSARRSMAVKAYIESMKKQIDIKIDRKLIS